MLAAANTSQETNSTRSKSGSIGISLSAAGLSANASASKSKGAGQGNSTNHTNTQVSGQTVEIESGSDTTIKGAVVQGRQVNAQVGGNLNIESLQDTNQYSESSKSSGFSVSVPITGGSFGASASSGKTNTNSNYASVTEQSGIKAGDGGFNVTVAGNTALTGAVITSTQKAADEGKNSFTTAGQSAQEAMQSGNLTVTDIQNSASYSAKASSLSIGVSKGQDANTGNNPSTSPNSIGFGSDKGSASSITSAGITGLAGDKTVTTGQDSTNALKPIFDADQVKQDVNAQVQIMQTALPRMAKAIGDEMQTKREDLRQQAKNAEAAGDAAKASQLEAEAKKYDEGGIYHGISHAALGALAGGLAGALGAGATSAAAPLLQEVQDKMQASLMASGMSQADAKAAAGLLTGVAAAGIGAAVSGGTAGAATGFNADMNNRQLHPTERVLANQLAAKSGGKYTAEQIEEQMRLMGNQHIGQQANTPDVATTPEQNAQRIQNDPSMPIAVQGNVAVEVSGQYNAEIQRFIQANTTNAGYIPGQSPYVGSNPQAGSNSNHSSAQGAAPTTPKTASCGNSDLDCKSGIGVNQSQPVLTPQQRQAAGDFFAKTSTDYQRLAAISAATGNAQVTLSFEIAAGVSGLLEQAFTPSVGKVVVDTLLVDWAAQEFSKRTGIPLFFVNEVAERDIKPRLEVLRSGIDNLGKDKK